MKQQKSICIIGIGVFGSAIVDQLLRMRQRNISIMDVNEKALIPYKSSVNNSFVADATSIRALEEVGVENFDVVIVASKLNIEIIASLLEFNVKNIIARATNSKHTRVLKKIGVRMIVRPEEDSGIRTALIATNEKFLANYEDITELGGDYVIGRTVVLNNGVLNTKINRLPLNNVNIVFIKRKDDYVLPKGDEVLLRGDFINIFGKLDDVVEMIKIFSNKKD